MQLGEKWCRFLTALSLQRRFGWREGARPSSEGWPTQGSRTLPRDLGFGELNLTNEHPNIGHWCGGTRALPKLSSIVSTWRTKLDLDTSYCILFWWGLPWNENEGYDHRIGAYSDQCFKKDIAAALEIKRVLGEKKAPRNVINKQFIQNPRILSDWSIFVQIISSLENNNNNVR